MIAQPLADPLSAVSPAYGRGSLADVMPSVLHALGVAGSPDTLALAGPLAGVRRVAVLLIDGFGYYQLPVAAPHAPLINDVWSGRLGQKRPLTTGFPSTTPTSLVSLGTGAGPGAHGILGFRVNVPGTDRILVHVDWSDDPDPRQWQPVPTQLEVAEAAGITVTAVSRPEFEGTGLTIAANRGGAYRSATDSDGLAVEIRAALAVGDGPTLVYGYYPDLDKAGHAYGVDSPVWRLAAAQVDRLLTNLTVDLPADTAILMTADHGQLNVPPDHRFDMDDDPAWRSGVRLVAGEARARYLYLEPGAEADVLATWRGKLGEAAWVGSREEAIAAGWFGPVPARHAERIGDVVAVARKDYVIAARQHDEPRELDFVGFHGALTAAEMTIPLVILRG